jgi:hypothetical protein
MAFRNEPGPTSAASVTRMSACVARTVAAQTAIDSQVFICFSFFIAGNLPCPASDSAARLRLTLTPPPWEPPTKKTDDDSQSFGIPPSNKFNKIKMG